MVLSLPLAAKLFLASSVLGSFAGNMNGIYFNLYLKALGYGMDLIGVLSAIPGFVVVGLALVVGVLAGRLGYKRLILAGMGLQAGAWIIPAFLPVPAWLLSAAFLAGVGGTLAGVAGGPLLSELSEGRARERLFGWQAGLGVLAGVAGSAVAGVLPGILEPRLALPPGSAEIYRVVIIVSFGIFLLSILPMLALPRRTVQTGLGLRALLPHRKFLADLIVINGLIGLGAGLLLPFVNLFFKMRFQVPDPTLGLIFSLNSLLIGTGNLLSPFLAQRVGRIRLVVFCQALSLPFFFVWGYAPSLFLSVLGYLVRATLMNLAGPMFSVAVLERVPAPARGGISAVSMVFWNGGWALGALISGFVQAHYGFAPLFPITMLLYSVAIYRTSRAFRAKAQE